MTKKKIYDLIANGHYLLAADALQNEISTQTPAVVGRQFNPKAFTPWASKPQEHFLVACLNFKQQLGRIVVAHIGTLDNTPVHPRDVFRIAILENAGFIVLGHNHPSGLTAPSVADIELTNKLVEAGNVLRIPVLDHYIITTTGVSSLRAQFPAIFGVDA